MKEISLLLTKSAVETCKLTNPALRAFLRNLSASAIKKYENLSFVIFLTNLHQMKYLGMT